MAISYPFDLLDGFMGHSVDFDLMWRQEQSRQASGRTIVKDMGSPLWRASYQSAPKLADELDRWRARVHAMENGLKTFKGYPISRLRPINRPGSSALPSGTVSSIGADRKTIALSGFSALTLQVGDMVRIGARDLHQIIDVAGGAFEVRPYIWPGVTPGVTASVDKPYCIMAIVPGSVSSTADMKSGIGSVSFQAIEAR